MFTIFEAIVKKSALDLKAYGRSKPSETYIFDVLYKIIEPIKTIIIGNFLSIILKSLQIRVLNKL
jgi:hypothetical protein